MIIASNGSNICFEILTSLVLTHEGATANFTDTTPSVISNLSHVLVSLSNIRWDEFRCSDVMHEDSTADALKSNTE